VRCYQYQAPLAQEGIEMEILPLFGDDYVQALYSQTGRGAATLSAFARRFRRLLDISGYDAIWIEKEMLPWLPAFMELALLPRHSTIILDFDDAVFHRYDMHASAVVRAVFGHKLDRLMARADLVLAGNAYLADRARSAGAPKVSIVPTVVDLNRYQPLPPRVPDVVTVGWIGSPNTAHYLSMVKPVINALERESPLKAVAIGARPDQVAGSPFTAVAWTEESEVDSDSPWERGKCGYKLIQYMALGLPVVASPVGVNVELLAGGGNGFLAASDHEWKKAISTLISNPDLRRSMGRAGRKLVESHYSVASQTPRLVSLYNQVIS
jgi:glycosyltransferase involved in cell wall biosynthesis